MRSPAQPLDGCDHHPDCLTCPLMACAYPNHAAEQRFRRRSFAAFVLIRDGWSPSTVADLLDLQPAYVEGLARWQRGRGVGNA